MASAETINEIIKLYVGYYNRAPDPEGLDFWIASFDNGFSLEAMSADFSTQVETVQTYPFFLNTAPTPEDFGEFVESVYQNLFNRPPDVPGKAFWVDKLFKSEFSVGEVISLIIAGATTSPDVDVVANKVAVGLDFYTKTKAQPTFVFDANDIEAATDIQARVTQDPVTVADAGLQTDAYVLNLAGNGKFINLTKGLDLPGGAEGGTDTRGTDGDDLFFGTVQLNGIGTLQHADFIQSDRIARRDEDVLEGRGGNDTLNLRFTSLQGTADTAYVPLRFSSIEFLNVDSQGADGSELILDFLLGTGTLKHVAVSGGGVGGRTHATTVLENVGELNDFRLVDFDGILTVAFDDNQRSDANNSINLYVEASGRFGLPAMFNTFDERRGDFEPNIKIANIETGKSDAAEEGGSALVLNALLLQQINVTGTERLFLSDSFSGFRSVSRIDASGMDGGGLVIGTEGKTESPLTFIGSGFDDALRLRNLILSNGTELSLDAGGGTDTLSVESFEESTIATINTARGFEHLEASRSLVSFDASDFTGIDTFVLSGQTPDSTQLNISGITQDDRIVFLNDVGQRSMDTPIRFEAFSAGQSLRIEMVANPTRDGNIVLFSADNSSNASAIGFGADNAFEVVEIVSSGSSEFINIIAATGSDGTFAAIDNSDGQINFNISGAHGLAIAAREGIDFSTSGNERGFTAGVDLNGGTATGPLRIAGSVESDVIQGGSGDDILYGLGGNDFLVGNAGADQFRFSDWDGTDQIVDFVRGTDQIGLNRVDFAGSTGTVEGTALTGEGYTESFFALAELDASASRTVIELQETSGTAQITSVTAATMDAYLFVFNATTERGELWFDDDWSTTSGRSQTAELANITDLTDLIGFSSSAFLEYIF